MGGGGETKELGGAQGWAEGAGGGFDEVDALGACPVRWRGQHGHQYVFVFAHGQGVEVVGDG